MYTHTQQRGQTDIGPLSVSKRETEGCSRKGFTLLETILYIGLFSILITGLLLSVYPLLTGSDKISTRALSAADTAFIIRKINTVLASATSANIISPIVGTSSSTLSVTSTAALITNTHTFTEDGNYLMYKVKSRDAVPINTDRIPVKKFFVKHVASVDGVPRYIEYSFLISGIVVGPIRKYFPY